jgi:hypothetical protein
MEARIVSSFLKNDHEMVVGEINEYKEKWYAHVRILVPSVDGEWIHTDQGVAIEVGRVDELREATEKLLDVAGYEVTVGRLSIGKDEIRVGVNQFRGATYAYIRRFYTKGGEWLPTRRGVSIHIAHVSDLVDLVRELADGVKADLS